jgi:hypothetical protein
MDRNHIQVLPNLSGKKHMPIRPIKLSKPDPDVNTILKQQTDDVFNVLKMGHEPTDEEKNSKMNNDKTKKIEKNSSDEETDKVVGYSWLVMSLAFIVIILMVFIVWWVLKENREPIKHVIPPGIMRPHNVPMQRRGGVYPSHPVQQSENMPIQTQNMPGESTKQPTKGELESILSQMKLTDIPEESDENVKHSEVTIEVVDQVSDEKPIVTEVLKEDIMDDALVSSFNAILHGDAEDDKVSDDLA